MKTLTTVIATLVGVAVAGGVAYGGYRLTQSPDYARVVAVTPTAKHWTTPQKVCHRVAIRTQQPSGDSKHLIGAALGAVAGGVLGHQVGGGHGKDVATAVGAIAGAYAGQRTEQRLQSNSTATHTEQRCHTIQQPHSKATGYRVTYEYQGKRQHIHLHEKPGKRLPISDGQVSVQ